MRYRKTANMISLLGGALVGAAAMYLLDPETGKRRRHSIRAHADDYLGSAGEMLHGGWEKVSHRAKDWGGTVAEKAQDYGQRLSGMARDLGGKAHEYSGAAGDVAEDVTDYGNQLWRRVRGLGKKLASRTDEALEARRPSGPSRALLPISLTGVGCCAVGAGLMYLMDPQRGRSRRAWLADKVASVVRGTGRSLHRRGEDLANRAYGMAHETRAKFQASGPISSEQLLERIRSEMGRAVSHPWLIQVMADANGTVTLTGRVLASEADRLISTIEAVRGVNLVVNRCDVKNTEQELNAEQNPTQQRVPQT